MKFKRIGRLERSEGQFDMVPLINCVFLLLIFFLLTSTYVARPGIKVNLPKAVTSEAVVEKSLVILVTDKDEIFLNDRVISTSELVSRLRIAAKEDRPLLITADRRASLGKVVEIWDLCRDKGITRISIATQTR